MCVLGRAGSYARRDAFISLDGYDDFVQSDNALDLRQTPFSVAVWLRRSDMATSTKAFFYQSLVSYGSPELGRGWAFQITGEGRLRLVFPGGESEYATTTLLSPPLLDNEKEWHLYSMSFDPVTLEQKLFRNGVEVARKIVDASQSLANVPPSQLYIGANADGRDALWGHVDNVRVYRRLLSLAEHDTIYNVDVVVSARSVSSSSFAPSSDRPIFVLFMCVIASQLDDQDEVLFVPCLMGIKSVGPVHFFNGASCQGN